MGSSQQVLELKPVDLGALGSLSDCGVSQPLWRMEWARNHPDYQGSGFAESRNDHDCQQELQHHSWNRRH